VYIVDCGDLERPPVLVPWLSKPWSLYNASSWKRRDYWTCLHAGEHYIIDPHLVWTIVMVFFSSSLTYIAYMVFCFWFLCSDVCSYYFSSCTRFLDIKIHNNNGRWQSRGAYKYECFLYARLCKLAPIKLLLLLTSLCIVGLWESSEWFRGWSKYCLSAAICKGWDAP
jgi:hypothetical protein